MPPNSPPFRMTQTRDKLAREGIRNQQQAIHTHEQVGKEVRDAIKRIAGDRPERIPFAYVIEELQAIVLELNAIVRSAGFAMEEADEMFADAARSFWRTQPAR